MHAWPRGHAQQRTTPLHPSFSCVRMLIQNHDTTPPSSYHYPSLGSPWDSRETLATGFCLHLTRTTKGKYVSPFLHCSTDSLLKSDSCVVCVFLFVAAASDVACRCASGLVLDLDETLVHSSFKPVPNADFVVPIEIDGQHHHVYVLKRPHVDRFLKAMAPLFEVRILSLLLLQMLVHAHATPLADSYSSLA